MRRQTGAICTCGWQRRSRRGRLWDWFVTWSFDHHEPRCPDLTDRSARIAPVSYSGSTGRPS